MFRLLANGHTEYYMDGDLRAIIAAENLAAFKASIGIVEPPADAAPVLDTAPVLEVVPIMHEVI